MYPGDEQKQADEAIDRRIRERGYCNENPLLTRENNYTGYGDGSTPEAAVTWWMQSPSHRATILDPALNGFAFGLEPAYANDDGAADSANLKGTFVSTFGKCEDIEDPPPPPPLPPEAFSFVEFDSFHVRDCDEAGICDWRVQCKVGDAPHVGVIWYREVNTGRYTRPDIPIVSQPRKLPLTLSCEVRERDGPGIDPAVDWTVLDTITLTYAHATPPGTTESMRFDGHDGSVDLHFRIHD